MTLLEGIEKGIDFFVCCVCLFNALLVYINYFIIAVSPCAAAGRVPASNRGPTLFMRTFHLGSPKPPARAIVLFMPHTKDDLAATAAGVNIPEGFHAIRLDGTGVYVIMSCEALDKRARSDRGRPLQFTLAEAQRIHRDYWTGEKTASQLARDHRCSRLTISNLVHGRTYWWI